MSSTLRSSPSALLLALALAACNPVTSARRDTGLDGLALESVQPATLLFGTTLAITGRSFVDSDLGTSTLVLAGASKTVRLPLTYVSSSQMAATANAPLITAIGNTPNSIAAHVEVVSTVDGKTYRSATRTVELRATLSLQPTLGAIGDGVIYVNQSIPITGADLLVGGAEGQSRVVLDGCFRPGSGGICGVPRQTTLPLVSDSQVERTAGHFVYSPAVSGIRAGQWTGTVRVENVHADGTVTQSSPIDATFDVQPPTLTGLSTSAASLGQYVLVTGGGFVGGTADATTTLHLVGSFAPTSGGKATPIDLELVPEVRSGLELRYVLDEQDTLGQTINLRQQPGTITGQLSATVESGTDSLTTAPVAITLAIAPVRQVVFVNFLDEWIRALRRFGLRAADQRIRDRVLAVGRRDYQAINLDFRAAPPTDFAVFSQVDIGGLYPAGDHSFGYDNTPGKDLNNQRLYDRIGGVNAVTQLDGDPGYGGIFLESFFLFSEHPPTDILGSVKNDPSWELARDPRFDPIFDPFRVDRGGRELTAGELETLQPSALESAETCPAVAGDRRSEVACAIFVLGSMIGSTMTHEIGHSLGLADPYGSNLHNQGDCPSRLMDGGGDRPFVERAELGAGPARFCTTDYDYLRTVLPSVDAPPLLERPECDRCQ